MKNLIFITWFLIFGMLSFSQENEPAYIHGNFQLNSQTYSEDSVIGATRANEIMLMNTYANFIYTKGNFSAGTRFEGYLNSMQGFKPVNEGVGFPYRWVKYNSDNLEITAGSYYEQFGSGMILRSYEDKTLGYDNALDGIRIKYHIGSGVLLKAVYGRQRLAQQYVNNIPQLINGRGIVRGIDGEFSINDIFNSLSEKNTRVIVGGSFVSKYEKDDNPIYKIPENVGAGGGRINISHGGFNVMGEYVYKSMDPSSGGTDNSNGNVGQNYIYKSGQGLFLTATYSKKGLGVSLMAKQIDNMNFRSERTAKLNDLNINYIPDITKNEIYTLTAIYPYGTQLNGEAGFQAEVLYKFKKESLLGGKYGTLLTISYSTMNSVKKNPLTDSSSLVSNDGTKGYTSGLFKFGNELFYEDINVEVSKKFSKKLKGIFILQSLKYNNSIIHGTGEFDGTNGLTTIHGADEFDGTIHGLAAVADVSYKFAKRKTLRTELQHFNSKDYLGNWTMVLFEYSIPHWFFTAVDQINNSIHYYNFSTSYVKGGNRIEIGYGKQREGIVCTGGVCRRIPASYGFSVSITSSF
ncbi:MAG: hypothetical protein GXO79_07395 [Chlorobi bacterium]|nr:hypothetical protein [Chlorobiota bacterium]